MPLKRSPLTRSKPPRRHKHRQDVTVGKLGRVRLRGAELAKLRLACLVRDKYHCVVCGCPVSWESFEMAHIQSRGAFGSDTLENVLTKCRGCHDREHHPKAVPPKPTQ
jgi:5-methylcytosine-specific restriction endonuclease McrA